MGKIKPYRPRITRIRNSKRTFESDEARRHVIRTRISDTERAKLTKWRQLHGLTVSQALRYFIQRHTQFGTQKRGKSLRPAAHI